MSNVSFSILHKREPRIRRAGTQLETVSLEYATELKRMQVCFLSATVAHLDSSTTCESGTCTPQETLEVQRKKRYGGTESSVLT